MTTQSGTAPSSCCLGSLRYSLSGVSAPLAVADYTYDALPQAAREAVPTDTELADATGAALNELTTNAAQSAGDSDAACNDIREPGNRHDVTPP